MTTRSALVLTVVVVCFASFALAQPADPPLVNWTAPPSWTPSTGHQVHGTLGMASGQNVPVKTTYHLRETGAGL